MCVKWKWDLLRLHNHKSTYNSSSTCLSSLWAFPPPPPYPLPFSNLFLFPSPPPPHPQPLIHFLLSLLLKLNFSYFMFFLYFVLLILLPPLHLLLLLRLLIQSNTNKRSTFDWFVIHVSLHRRLQCLVYMLYEATKRGCKKIKINTLTFFFNQGFSLLLLLFLD